MILLQFLSIILEVKNYVSVPQMIVQYMYINDYQVIMFFATVRNMNNYLKTRAKTLIIKFKGTVLYSPLESFSRESIILVTTYEFTVSLDFV